jgi:hypothetical protein
VPHSLYYRIYTIVLKSQGHVGAVEFDLVMRQQLHDYAQRRMAVSCNLSPCAGMADLRLMLTAAQGSHISRSDVWLGEAGDVQTQAYYGSAGYEGKGADNMAMIKSHPLMQTGAAYTPAPHSSLVQVS